MSGGLRKYAVLPLITLALALFPACSWWSSVTYPVPVSDAGSDETAFAFQHNVQINWNGEELGLLDSFEVDYPSSVSIIQSLSSDEFSVQIQFDVEKPNDTAYAQEYMQQITAQSQLNAQNAELHIPPPTHLCQQTFNAQGQLNGLTGICVRQLVISVPASHAVPITVHAAGDFALSNLALPSLQLVLQDGTHSTISGLDGNLTVTGGGPGATLSVTDLGDTSHKAGNLNLILNAIGSAELSQIQGTVFITLAHPPTTGAPVVLDGTAITKFPYQRSAP
jgi:hypothetical protein